MHLPSIAIIGAGLAGSVCAHTLSAAGCRVTVFDKSRGVGGRMATRRIELDRGPDPTRLSLDHGVGWWPSGSGAFETWLQDLARTGAVASWAPRLRDTSGAVYRAKGWVAQPDMPALCRHLLQGVALHTACPIEALVRGPRGWQLIIAEVAVGPAFDAVVVAIPPAQAVTLLQAHQPTWAVKAQALDMLGCWTLMAVAGSPAGAGQPSAKSQAMPDLGWDILDSADGPLMRLSRQGIQPGRTLGTNYCAWVAHASPGWSRAHLEDSPETARPVLLQALNKLLPSPMDWVHTVVHRWRYAQAAAPRAGGLQQQTHMWDSAAGLGTCGDHLGGGGLEGAWHSGQDLALHLLTKRPPTQS